MRVITIQLNRELDKQIESVMPAELRGLRKAGLRTHAALREYLASHRNRKLLPKTG